MNEEKLLKRAAAYSLVLMICIVTFSTGMKTPHESVSYASEVIKTPTPSIETNEIAEENLVVEAKKIEEESILPVEIDKKISKKYGQNLIAIRKPDHLSKDYSFSIEDLAVDRRIVVTITGLKKESINADNIYRIYENNYNCGQVNSNIMLPIVPISDAIDEARAEEPAYTQENSSNALVLPTESLTPTPIPTDSVTSLDITYTSTPDKNVNAVLTLDLIKTYGYVLKEDKNYFYICLVNPHDIYDTIVVLDAGHGGNDSGTYSHGNEYLEKDMNLDMLLKLQEYFMKNENIKIYTTRSTDRRLTLNQRVNLANDVNADLFLSIHCNANLSREIHGTEVLYNENQNDWNIFNSKQFAKICLEELVKKIGLKDRGIVARSRDVLIIGESKVPVALVEVAFMSNKEDMNFLKQEKNRKKAAEGIYNGIIRALEVKNGKVYDNRSDK
ncbi:MAG: N-acetylmuramoyl-L-alanine amidase [Clostridiales bacterium]|nr:N-acetylmuramoyl-L-alanine amidase [Clostridiales bacterium]